MVVLITCKNEADPIKNEGAILRVFWFGLVLNIPVNNFCVMLGQGHRFLGFTSTFWGVNMSCSRTQHGDPSGA